MDKEDYQWMAECIRSCRVPEAAIVEPMRSDPLFLHNGTEIDTICRPIRTGVETRLKAASHCRERTQHVPCRSAGHSAAICPTCSRFFISL
jgi:hypothetical protein